jgi:hypothetical protein
LPRSLQTTNISRLKTLRLTDLLWEGQVARRFTP